MNDNDNETKEYLRRIARCADEITLLVRLAWLGVGLWLVASTIWSNGWFR